VQNPDGSVSASNCKYCVHECCCRCAVTPAESNCYVARLPFTGVRKKQTLPRSKLTTSYTYYTYNITVPAYVDKRQWQAQNPTPNQLTQAGLFAIIHPEIVPAVTREREGNCTTTGTCPGWISATVSSGNRCLASNRKSTNIKTYAHSGKTAGGELRKHSMSQTQPQETDQAL
jgi:hypothetical protein